jgi:hypothetical protein
MASSVSLRDVQIAARHADPRTTMRYDPVRKTSTDTQLHPGRLYGLRNANRRQRDFADVRMSPTPAFGTIVIE